MCRGHDYERLEAFQQRMLNEFPHAIAMQHVNQPDQTIYQADAQCILGRGAAASSVFISPFRQRLCPTQTDAATGDRCPLTEPHPPPGFGPSRRPSEWRPDGETATSSNSKAQYGPFYIIYMDVWGS